MYTTIKLVRITDQRPATRKEDGELYHDFQLGVLLALKADGHLTEGQCHRAEKALHQKQMERGEVP